MQIAGACPQRPGWDCFMAFNSKYGASGMAQRCDCQPASVPNQRICSCDIVCPPSTATANLPSPIA